jgi:acyl-CoA dehydrogenase
MRSDLSVDFTIPPDISQLGEAIRLFVREKIVPYESDPRWSDHGPSEELRLELVSLARGAGLLSPHVDPEYGGLGLTHVGRAVAFEAAGYSTLGPIALNFAAPDEGNMHLMEMVGTAAQKQRWLAPLARGETRSCFAMTEPDNGAGSDPGLMKTTARRDGDDYVINGRKWLITGARGAAFAIIMAKIDGGEHDGKATMFLSDMNRSGIVASRLLDTMDSNFPGGHWVLDFAGLRVPESDVLGAVGQGFHYAQVRLAPARLTHCMRWLGAACRAHEIAVGYSRNRRAFGKTLGEHEGVGFMLADNEIDLHSSRLMILHTAWTLDQGRQASIESSMAKVFCSEALWRVADRCVQILGGLGITRDTVVERIFRDIRAFRIYDGPSEVHRWSLARHVQRA